MINEYFKYSAPYNWTYKFPLYWFKNIVDFFRWIKWTAQRAFRGYADCDVWNTVSYLNKIIIPMLEHLRDHSGGYPAQLESPEEWSSLLNTMIEGFKASERISDCEYEGIGETWKAQIERDESIQKNGMKVFSEYYNGLWD